MAPERIAVLGGGAGSLSTVFALTSRPGWQERFDIAVYQMGWRLGGKGASGRDRANFDRIYEHGFHMWMGFYANAFTVMRECYAERQRILDDPGVFREWSDAFHPHTRFVFSEHIDGGYRPWVIDYPTYPGDPSEPGQPLHPWDYLVMALRLLRDRLAASRHGAAPAPHRGGEAHPLLAALARRLGHDLEALGIAVGVVALEAAIQVAELIGRVVERHTSEDHALLVHAIEHARARIARQLEGAIERDDEARRLFLLLDLGCTVLKGIVADRVMTRGFDAIDDVEFRDWLRAHGASELAIGSTPIAALYAANFSYIGGRVDAPNFAAGVALQSYLRIFLASRGAFAWVLQSGMGDVVFSPLYQVLKARGVKFEFFHRVRALQYDAGSNGVTAIEMERQVALSQPYYEPIYRVRGVDAWPSAPFCEQIEHGDELAAAIARGEIDLESSWSPAWKDARPVRLEKGVHYDTIVLGISLGALRAICSELVEAKPAWRAMVDHVVTVPTQAQQLWLKPDLAALGWQAGSACVEGYPSPLGQWLDATHAIARESWPEGSVPGCLIYFCDAFEDAGNPGGSSAFPDERLAVARAGARGWLEQYAGVVWPAAAGPDRRALDWNLLADARGASGVARLASQFCRVNVEPSERFVLSVAGSTQYRLTADGSGVNGLFLTGDWVRNGFNVGCVESTVMSGLQCARAIAGYPQEIAHEHFFRIER